MSSHDDHDKPSPRTLPKRVCVLGAGGMVGRAWVGLLRAHRIECDAFGRAQLDLSNLDAVGSLNTSRYDLLVNAAAWTDVDGAEDHFQQAKVINAQAVEILANRCVSSGTQFVTYSTDYVFDGCASNPYAVDHPRDPINAYGRSKALGEQALEALTNTNDARWLCIRTSWVYAPWGKNFVRTIARLAFTRASLSVVDDQRGRPTSAENLARMSLALVLNGAHGFAHATDAGECSWYDFAREIVSLIGASCRVEPCTSDAYPRPAARPAYSVLDLSQTETRIGPMIPWQLALANCLQRMERDT